MRGISPSSKPRIVFLKRQKIIGLPRPMMHISRHIVCDECTCRPETGLAVILNSNPAFPCRAFAYRAFGTVAV